MFEGKDITPWRERAQAAKAPRGPGWHKVGLKIGKRSRIERSEQLSRVIAEAIAIYYAKGRKEAIEYIAGWRDWIKDYLHTGEDLDCSGTLLDRWLKHKRQ